MNRAVPRAALALAGFAAGVLVGGADGLWAGIAAGASAAGTVAAMLLAASIDGALGVVAGAGVEVVGRFALWGRAVRARRWSYVAAALLTGGAAASVTIVVISLSLARRNRFLAAGQAAAAGAACAVVGAAILPVVARAFSNAACALRRRRSVTAPAERGRVDVDPPRLLLWPVVLAVVAAVVLQGATGITAPVTSGRALTRTIIAGLEMGVLPALLVLAERIPMRWKGWRPAVVVAVALVIPVGVAATRTWSEHLRFLPWVHIVPAALMVVVGVALALAKAGRWRAGKVHRGLIAAIAFVVALLIAGGASESEQARKLTATRVAFVGPTLAAARQVLDRDHDGFSPWFGGGDCDDGDPLRYPGTLDLPDDGIDQDCDGRDASFAALAPGPFAPVPDGVPRDLNLLLVTVDTVRADHLHCYGYPRPTSPHIDALAAEGALFTNGWAHAPSTRYSMPAIATGRWPSAIAWDESIWWPRIAPSVPTLAEALKAAGYVTGAFYSYDYFSPGDRRGFERGVDHYRADRAVLHQAVNGPMESHGSSSREMADDTIDFLQRYGREKFFLWVHLYDPHLSYEPHQEVPAFGTSRVDRYDGEIRYTDLHLGRVFARLRELGLWDRTAIVVTGDHGEGFGEHGVTEHGFDLYAPQTQVPFIVRVPGLGPRRIAAPAGHVDIAPTLLNLARAPQTPSFLGRSLVADLTGASPPARPRAVFQEVTSERGKKRALVTEDLHLIWNWTPENTTECYDRRTDPDERRDLWGTEKESPCRDLKIELRGMVSALAMPADAAQRVRGNVFPSAGGAPRPATPFDARIGDVVRVAGYELKRAPAGGGDAEVIIHFDSLKPIAPGWRFFFHLTGPAGFRNLDHVPVEGAMPPERWRPGQRILDHVRLPFPPDSPPGSYTLLLGLYQGGQRMDVTPPAASDGNRALRLVTVPIP